MLNVNDRVKINSHWVGPDHYIGAQGTVTSFAPPDKNRSADTRHIRYVVVRFDSDLLGLFGRGILLETELDKL